MWVEFKPKHPRYTERIYYSMSPPSRFVTVAVDFAVMPATERNDKLITHLAGQSAALGETQMMRVRGAAPTNETGLLGD